MNPEFLDVLIFEVAGGRHGVPASDVQELLPALAVMPVPGSAADVEGVFNLRGAVVPVLNVRKRFGMPTKNATLSDHFVIIRVGERLTALHVDRALDLARLNVADLTEVDTPHARENKPRVAKLGDGMVMLHSAADLVASVGKEANR